MWINTNTPTYSVERFILSNEIRVCMCVCERESIKYVCGTFCMCVDLEGFLIYCGVCRTYSIYVLACVGATNTYRW